MKGEDSVGSFFATLFLTIEDRVVAKSLDVDLCWFHSQLPSNKFMENQSKDADHVPLVDVEMQNTDDENDEANNLVSCSNGHFENKNKEACNVIAVAERCASKYSSNPVATDVIVKRTSNKFTRKVGKLSKGRSDEKENEILLTGAKRMNKSGYLLNNSNCKKNSSYATGSRTQQRKLFGKETKQNTFVSNVTSFIPMVQGKQAAALSKAAGGKRDIKVKALEVAEAAKLQQEKRDQERKLQKEAMQQERARVERENSRVMKLNKKKNDERKKQKDDGIVAKKRGREEEERKRKRMEEAKSQRLEEGKYVGDKVDKEQRLPVLDGDNKKKDANNEFQKRKDLSMESKDHVTFEKHATKLTVNGSTSDVQHASLSLDVCGTSGDSLDDMKVTPAITKYCDANNLILKVQEKSYEISPYQNSDEEDDNDDDYYVSREKYIPPWASESCVAFVLPLQKGY